VRNRTSWKRTVGTLRVVALAIDWEQVQEDARHMKEILAMLFFAGSAIFGIGENAAWNVLPSIIETAIYYLIIVFSALFFGWLIYGRYTVEESAGNSEN